MEMRQLVGVGTVVDFYRIERGLDRLRGAGDIFGEERKFGFGQLEEFVDMTPVGDDAAAGVGLFLEEVQGRGAQRGDFDHQVMQALIFAAIEAVGEFAHGM